MATPPAQLFSLVIFFLYIVGPTESSIPKNFVESSCGATRYPAVCVQSLSSQVNVIQQSPFKLARTALTVSLAMAKSTKLNILKMTNNTGVKATEYGALKNCLKHIQSSVDRLNKSVREIEQLSRVQGDQFIFHKSNVQTWTSAALTEMDTCADEFSGKTVDGNIKVSVQGQITNVEQLISNALAFVNKM